MSKTLYTLALTVAAMAAEGCATSRVNITPAMTAPTKQEAAEILRTHSSRVGYLRNRALRQTDTQRLRPLAAVYAGIGEVEKLNDGFRVNVPQGTSMATDDYEAALERVLVDADQNQDNIITFPEIVWITKNVYKNIKEGRAADHIPPQEKRTAVAKASAKAPSKGSGFKHDTRMVAKPTAADEASEKYKKQAAYVQRSPLKTYQYGYLMLENQKNTIDLIAGIYAGDVKISKREGKFYVQKKGSSITSRNEWLKVLSDIDTTKDRIITPMELRTHVLQVYERSASRVSVKGPVTQKIARNLEGVVQKESKAQEQKHQVKQQTRPAAKHTVRRAERKPLVSAKEMQRREKRKQKRGWRNFYFNYGRKHHGRKR